ncbi:30S ribosomal protein S12 methylthiotransferase RimO [candidate division WOR-3 bacterium]|nr:30S ribosomal protein S12 methylthiotransferase RimO [candidate division WOR-3 bacterium]
MKCTILSLGCPKNLVESEEIIGTLGAAGCSIAAFPEDADVVIINTCGFIAPALEETRQEIHATVSIAKKNGARVYVYGCAVERAQDELRREFPSIQNWFRIPQRQDMLEAILHEPAKQASRLITTPGYAYLKIADGCSNHCAYCTIPSIRGPFRSLPEKAILEQARELAALGIKELIVVAQDTTRYGEDLPDSKTSLAQLLRKCTQIPGIAWVRLLYAHPRGVTDELLREIAENDRICTYLDVPIQHSSDRLLAAMNRGISRKGIETLFKKIESIKGLSLRTTVIVGFPGETDDDFMELMNFIKNAPVTWLGVFKYSCEPGTPASRLTQIDPVCVQERVQQLMDLQAVLLHEHYRSELGKTRKVMVHDQNGFYCGHSEYSCPQIDDPIIICNHDLDLGRFYQIRIAQLDDQHLYGEVIDNG